jgi:hypothetical protein
LVQKVILVTAAMWDPWGLTRAWGPRGLGTQGPADPDTLCHKLVSWTTRGVQMTTKSKSKSDLDVRSGGGGPVGEKVAPVRAPMWDPMSPRGLGTH